MPSQQNRRRRPYAVVAWSEPRVCNGTEYVAFFVATCDRSLRPLNPAKVYRPSRERVLGLASTIAAKRGLPLMNCVCWELPG
jgi:hypothetical protein